MNYLKNYFKATVIIVFAIGFSAVVSGPAHAQGKTTLIMGSDKPGGITHAAATGVAKIVTQNTPLTVRVRAYSGAEAWMPEMDTGKIDFGTHFSATAWMTYNQIDSKLKLRNIRLLRSSAARLPLGFMVRKDSDIKSISDLKGKRVAGGYAVHPIMRRLAEGTMASYGLTWDDVKMVPVTSAVDGANAFINGRVDVVWFAVLSALTREANAKLGVRFLPLEPTPERLKIMQEKIYPGVMIVKNLVNTPWAPKGTMLTSYEYYIMGSSHTGNDSVKTALGALWDHEKELVNVHNGMRGFINKSAASVMSVIPYHPAAIEFYKSKGVWTDEAEKANQLVIR
ncbi:TAXI family TRAP transporter solute-binding subunit [Thermodesulfobacteriota bacterium]